MCTLCDNLQFVENESGSAKLIRRCAEFPCLCFPLTFCSVPDSFLRYLQGSVQW
jgi:hypothetical protein